MQPTARLWGVWPLMARLVRRFVRVLVHSFRNRLVRKPTTNQGRPREISISPLANGNHDGSDDADEYDRSRNDGYEKDPAELVIRDCHGRGPIKWGAGPAD